MNLQDDRESFFADTLNLIQRLANSPSLAPEFTAPPAEPMASPDDDFHSRIENFRNRQRFLQIEREAHYEMAMYRVRAATEQHA